MKHGIDLIAEERAEQIEKHGFSITGDQANNPDKQLSMAASLLLIPTGAEGIPEPPGWNSEKWQKMLAKPYPERVKIAGAFCAAELDRINL